MVKITKEQIEKIRELKSKGLTHLAIAKELGINTSTVFYWLSEENRRKVIEKIKSRFRILSPESKKIIFNSRREYQKNYCFKRYKEDEAFRAKVKERSRLWKRKKLAKIV